MKRLVVAATGLLAVLAFAPSALADTPDCVTRAEYRAVHIEDSIRRVHRIFDIRGRRLWIDGEGDYKTQKRRYRTCRASLVHHSAVQPAAGRHLVPRPQRSDLVVAAPV